MAVTVAQIQAVLIQEVGDLDLGTGEPLAGFPDQPGLLAVSMPVLWARYADKALIAPRLQELYTQRAALKLVLARVAPRVDFSEGPTGISVKQSQWVADRRTMLQTVEAEIQRVELRARVPVVGAITTQAPITPPIPVPRITDANDPRYAGTPYSPRPLGQFP